MLTVKSGGSAKSFHGFLTWEKKEEFAVGSEAMETWFHA